MNRILPVLTLVVLASGCPKEVECGEQGCPIGTAPEEYQANRQGYDVDLSADPKTYSGEVAFKTFGEAECQYQCVAIFTCSPDQYPFITESCYACAALTADGEIVQPECDTAGGGGTETAAFEDTGVSF